MKAKSDNNPIFTTGSFKGKYSAIQKKKAVKNQSKTPVKGSKEQKELQKKLELLNKIRAQKAKTIQELGKIIQS